MHQQRRTRVTSSKRVDKPRKARTVPVSKLLPLGPHLPTNDEARRLFTYTHTHSLTHAFDNAFFCCLRPACAGQLAFRACHHCLDHHRRLGLPRWAGSHSEMARGRRTAALQYFCKSPALSCPRRLTRIQGPTDVALMIGSTNTQFVVQDIGTAANPAKTKCRSPSFHPCSQT
jgi:hypothetical protein